MSNKIKIFIVTPEIEAWLLADKNALTKLSRSEYTKLAIERVINPEEVSYPEMIISNVFGNLREARKQYPLLIESMDIQTALSSSYTLRDFYNGLLDILEISKQVSNNKYDHPNYTEVQANTYKTLLLDSSNLDSIAFKTLEGEIFTYRELLSEIGSNSDVGKEYIFNLLRSERDILAYQAKKEHDKRKNS